ncbi:MAG TPA: hypothetical protein VJN43_12545 [Bryobacteraceae bacterium]|nr:hypothetical protein [Bryobacteraceae bacterium]
MRDRQACLLESSSGEPSSGPYEMTVPAEAGVILSLQTAQFSAAMFRGIFLAGMMIISMEKNDWFSLIPEHSWLDI